LSGDRSRGPFKDLPEEPSHLHLIRRLSRERRRDLHKVPSPGALQLRARPQDVLQVFLPLPTTWARRVRPLDPFPGFPKQFGATTPKLGKQDFLPSRCSLKGPERTITIHPESAGMVRWSIFDLTPNYLLNHLKGYPPFLHTIIRAKVGSLPGLLICPFVPEKAAMSRDPLEAYTTPEAP
jgi:hypothetical protein